MRKYIHLTLVIGHLTLLLALPVLAQGQGGTDLAVLESGVGARALGMGGAFTAIADNADAPYWNPAGLGTVSSSEITTMQTKLSTDADHFYISYVQKALGGTLGISWVQVALGNIAQTSSEVDQHNEVEQLGQFSYFSNAYLIAYGRELSDRVSIGLTAKYLNSSLDQIAGGQASGYSVTPGLLVRFPSPLTLGLKVDDLVNEQQWGTGTVERVPPKIRIGLAYKPADALLAVDVSQVARSGYSPEISLGFEQAIYRGIAFRTGYSSGGFTAGAGFAFQHALVDYAYVNQQALSRANVHRISLSGVW